MSKTKITDSCGCVYCDLGVAREPGKAAGVYVHDHWFHGRIKCTRPKDPDPLEHLSDGMEAPGA